MQRPVLNPMLTQKFEGPPPKKKGPVRRILGGTFGVLWALWRRYVQRVYRIRIKSKPEHGLILGTFLLIGLSGFGAAELPLRFQSAPLLSKPLCPAEMRNFLVACTAEKTDSAGPAVGGCQGQLF